MQAFIICKALCSKNSFAVKLCRQDEAGIYRISIHYDGTGSTLSFIAAFFDALEIQILAQESQKRLVARYRLLVLSAVDGDTNFFLEHLLYLLLRTRL